jgi:hypothetical protein
MYRTCIYNKMSRTNPNFGLSCPNPYKLDQTSGLCVEPTPPGFTLQNGRFFRNCPPGMTSNDRGLCIRPVMSRSSFINEKNVQNTSLAFGTANGLLVWGTYDTKAFDMTFNDSSQVNNDEINDIFLSPGSNGLFFVGQENVEALGLTTVGLKNDPKPVAVKDKTGQLTTDNATYKIQYSNQMGQLFLLSKPQTAIFNANYSASDFKNKSNAAGGVSLKFNDPTYNVTNLTEPFYVGDYSFLNFNETDQRFELTTNGALQNGLDAKRKPETKALPQPETQINGCLSEPYDPMRPTDPMPNFFLTVSDVTSRNITNTVLTSGPGSNGYVIVGNDPSSITSGIGYAIRYIDNDPCVIQNGAQPFIQFLATIDFGESGSDVRVARFDAEEVSGPDGALGPDTFYIIGSSATFNRKNVLSFLTENKDYEGRFDASYNGLSIGDFGVDNRNYSRDLVNTTSIENIVGYGIEAWNYNPIEQSLVFSVANKPPAVESLESEFTTTTLVFTENDFFQVPQDCISIQVFLWGGGGSCDAVAGGYGGAGAFVGGYLKNFSSGTLFEVLVGDGGGTPNRVGIGAGGGRSALSLNGRDFVTAGGGGGSVGRGVGGPATTGLKAGSGVPGLNGGLGATASGPGRGGRAFGDPRIQKVSDGKVGLGGNSFFAISKACVGGGGGGGGFYGGGAGAYLGYTNNINDVATGGGGGSSYSQNVSYPILIDGQGSNAPNTTSPQYQDNAAAGGTPQNGQGGPGLVVLVVTTNSNGVDEGAPTFDASSNIWYIAPKRFTKVTDKLRGSPTVPLGTVPFGLREDWQSIFSNVILDKSLFGAADPVSAVFSNNGLVVVVTQSSTAPFISNGSARVFWAFAPIDLPGQLPASITLKAVTDIENGNNVFGPIDKTSAVSLNNVREIRLFNPLSPQNGPVDIMFIGDGIRVLTAPLSATGSWSNPRYVSRPDETLDLNNVKLVDAQFNDSTQMIEAIGEPQSLNVSLLFKTPFSPVFASFYHGSDVSSEVCPWVGTGITGSMMNNPGVITEADLTVLPLSTKVNTLLYATYTDAAGAITTSLLTIYANPTSGVLPSFVAAQLTLALQAFLYELGLAATATAFVNNTNFLGIKITSLPVDSSIALVFASESTIVTPTILQNTQTLLGLGNPSVTNQMNGGFEEVLIDAQAPMLLQPVNNQSTTPSPISISFAVNDAFPGSIYHVYAPQVKLASGPVVVAIGGPFADPSNSALNNDLSGNLSLPRAIKGTDYYIDYVQVLDVNDPNGYNYQWVAYQVGPTRIVYDQGATGPINIRSPANILVSLDNGASFTFAKSIIQNSVSQFALTGLDMYHTFPDPTNSNTYSVGPARFTGLNGQGLLNAAVSQFNDVKYYPYNESGIFMAVGQFVWELNSMFSMTQWPRDVANLRGVAWVSIDGLSWTTIALDSIGTSEEPFWIVYKTEAIDIASGTLALLTDLAMYKFTLDDLYNTGRAALSNPSADYMQYKINLTQIGNTGPFAAVCKDRNPITGTCIKCETGHAALINQVIGEGGTIQSNLDICLTAPSSLPGAYSSLEAFLDGAAISAYAGYISDKPTPAEARIVSYRQSFAKQNELSNHIFICPKHTDPDITPASVIGRDNFVEDIMQCEFAATMQEPNGSSRNGLTVVRRPAVKTTAQNGSNQVTPDYSYTSQTLQENYVYEGRMITTTAYDSFSKVSSDLAPFPSTLGIGGSAIAPPSYLLGNYQAYGPLSPNVYSIITNQGFYPIGDMNIDGPFQQNQSMQSIAGANWNINTPPDRAVLANQDDLLSDFSYANALNMVYQPFSQGYSQYSQYSYYGPTASGQQFNPYLFKLSTMPFPYDSVSTVPDIITPYPILPPDENPDTSGPSGPSSGLAITPGRDPQVYEPGYGPLVRYLTYNEAGFPVVQEPWPANPLPEEAFGTWWIRPIGAESTGEQSGIFQGQLGYGSIIIGSGTQAPQTVLSLPQNSISPYTNMQTGSTISLFNYDSSRSTPSSQYSQEYLGLNTWSKFLPFTQGSADGSLKPDVSPTDTPDNLKLYQARSQFALYSMQNLLALRLKPFTRSTPPNSNLTNNWQFLVSSNFLRPRNWGFSGLKTNGTPVDLGNNVPQTNILSDQPNRFGQYEFLVPDPYFAQFPFLLTQSNVTTNSILGILSSGPQLSAAMAAYNTNNNGSAFPGSTSLIEGTAESCNIANLHNAFHYWTAPLSNKSTQFTYVLDLYVNVSKLYEISWLNAQAPLPEELQNYLLNPLASFTYFDPTAQTSRSLQSLLSTSGTPGSVSAILTSSNTQELLYNFLSPSQVPSRRANTFVPTYNFNQTSISLLHHQYTVTLNVNQLSSFDFTMNSNNVNSAVSFGNDRTTPVPGAFNPFADIRQGITPNLSFTLNAGINVTESNYDVELDLSLVFAQNGAPIRQDYLAHDPNLIVSGTSQYQFGHPLWGFGLRIDEKAVQQEVTSLSPLTTNNAALPVHHGYVSMVRTVIDSFGRFTGQQGLNAGPDAAPHFQRMTYITKYVPSRLQNYGAVVPYAPSRFITASSANIEQNILNPFRPLKSYYIEAANVMPWKRATYFASTASSNTDIYLFGAIDSGVADIEGPGIYGRQPFLVNADVFASGPYAGYEGVINGGFTTLGQNKSQSFRTLPTATQELANSISGSGIEYVPVNSTVFGQMLLDLSQLNTSATPPTEPSNVVINFENTGLPSPIAGGLGVTPTPMLASLITAYIAMFGGSPMVSFPTGTFVTHAEFLQLFCSALTAMFQTETFNGSSTVGLELTGTFDLLNDRPSFVLNYNNPPSGAYIYRFIMDVSSPMNNWLGLVSVNPFMYVPANDLGQYPYWLNCTLGNSNGNFQYMNIKDLEGNAIPKGTVISAAQLYDIIRATHEQVGGYVPIDTGFFGIKQNISYPSYYFHYGVDNTSRDFTYQFVGEDSTYGVILRTNNDNQDLLSVLISNGNAAKENPTNDVRYNTLHKQVFLGILGFLDDPHSSFLNYNLIRPTPTSSAGLFSSRSDSTVWTASASGGFYAIPGSTTPAPHSIFYEHSSDVSGGAGSDPPEGVDYFGPINQPKTNIQFSGQILDTCNITNVSFTTRLSSNAYPYYWGVASRIAAGTSLPSSISFYQASSELTVSQNTDKSFVQSVPTYQNLSPITNFSALVTSEFSSVTYELAGILGSGDGTVTEKHSKPSSYDSSTTFPYSTPGLQGVPLNSVLAQFILNNYTGGLVETQLAPIVAQNNMTGSLSSSNKEVYQLVLPSSSFSAPNSILIINQECYVNFGAMPSQNAVTTRLAAYVFNWLDFFENGPSYSSNPVYDFTTVGSRTYLQSVPYYIDELYDSSAQFSALGRSMKIDNTTLSSLGANLVTDSLATNPVIIILAYASTSATTIGSQSIFGTSTTPAITNTYSNFLQYPFSNFYQLPATYNIQLTPYAQGPLFAFFGLNNTVANDVVASNSTPNTQGLPRKRILDFDFIDNPSLGLDVRQVYPQGPLTIDADENTTGYALTNNTSAVFSFVTIDRPIWSQAQKTTSGNNAPLAVNYLPLAGTYIQDKNTLSDQPYSMPQIVPNYEGLSIMSEWRKNIASSMPNVVTSSLSYETFAVDRSILQVPVGPNSTSKSPFALVNLDQMRPTTKFVKLCDVWRNTIRASVVVPVEWQPSAFIKQSGISIDLMDCMGPEMYNTNDTTNNEYFGMCNGTLLSNSINRSFSKPSILSNTPSYTVADGPQGTFGTTPWGQNGQVWSPFTGGSYWNTFNPAASQTTQSDPVHFQFSPQLWYPTYSWNLANPDINNVWPTSVATNPELFASNQAVFSSTDGSLRKMTLGTATTPSFVSGITGRESFYNGAINKGGTEFVESYVDVGRIYNLTYWQSNWWFTADTASVWTTAPTTDGFIVAQPALIETFQANGIKFRPLSLNEGSPITWANANWPSNLPHKFNVMRVIDYAGSTALFVSSIDGEFMILTVNGSGFQATVNNENLSTLYTPKSPPEPTGSTSVFISDVMLSGPNIVIASLPLALDPQRFPVPWSTEALPILTLGHTGPNANGPVLMLQNQDWLSPLQDSNVVTLNFQLPLYTTAAGPDLGLFVNMYTSENYLNPISPEDGSIGITRIQQPANPSPTDALLPFFKNTLTDRDISLQSNLVRKDIEVIIEFLMLFNNAGNPNKLFPPNGVPVFYKAGFDMDFITKAYFSIDSPGFNNPKSTVLGLQDILPNPQSSTSKLVSIESIIAPMFSNTIAFDIRTNTTSSQLTSEYKHPTLGPLSEYQNSINDYLGLNIFQNMRALRTSPVQSNQIISNIAYAEELNAIAWTTFGPFGATGVTIASLDNRATTVVPQDPLFYDAHFLQQRPLLKWNPYELRWYAIGVADNMYDFASLEYKTDIYRPAGISRGDWSRIQWDPKDTPLQNNNSRLMIVYADASTGLLDLTEELQITEYAIKFQQVYKVVSASGPRTKESYVVRPLSREFTTIDAIEFSPSAVVFGGSAGSGPSQSARICFKTQTSIGSNDMKANWSISDLNVPGTVTAIKYVGYAFYIATWDPVALRSTLFFASLTFAGITSIDSWNSNSTQRITVIDAVLPPLSKCTEGFEPDPSNPAVCIKKCPDNYEPFGSLCVQTCPRPYSTNGTANECIPDSIAPRVTVPSARGQQLTSPAPKAGPCIGPNCANAESINYPVLISITTLVLIALAFVFGLMFAIRNKN